MPTEPKTFFVQFYLEDGKRIGHQVSITLDDLMSQKNLPLGENSENTSEPDTISSQEKTDFKKVFEDFLRVMESFHHFMALTLGVTPHMAKALIEARLGAFVEEHGNIIEDYSDQSRQVFELEAKHWNALKNRNEQVSAIGKGLELLPEILVIGLISSYDAFLSSLLRVAIEKHPEIVLTSNKEIKFSELISFSSIEEARQDLIAREIESVIRKSHHEQFTWMQNTFDVKLRNGLSIWPKFVELCERRNLLTHTGGVVSNQYLKNCGEHKASIDGISAGMKLDVDAAYFQSAVQIIYEVGIKLCYVFWRKFDQPTKDDADSKYNAHCLMLIQRKRYDLAEALLKFGVTVKGASDEVHKMMIVNYANTVRLQGRKEEAQKLLDTDWSASSDTFKVCVAAVREDVDEVIRIMQAAHKTISPSDYRDWPVFIGVNTDERFLNAFSEIFEEPYISPPPAQE